MDTNNHNDFFAIGKLQPLQTNNIIYGFVRLFNGIQVGFSHSFHSTDEVTRSTKCQKPLFLHTTCILHGGFCLHVTSSSVGTGRNTSASVRGWR